MTTGQKILNELRQMNFLNPVHMYKTFFIGLISGDSKSYRDRTYLFRTHGKIIGLNFKTEKEDLMFDTVVRTMEFNGFSIESMKNLDAIVGELENEKLRVKCFIGNDKVPVCFDVNEYTLRCRDVMDKHAGVFEVLLEAVDKGIFSDAFLDYNLHAVSFNDLKKLFNQDFSLDEVLEEKSTPKLIEDLGFDDFNSR